MWPQIAPYPRYGRIAMLPVALSPALPGRLLSGKNDNARNIIVEDGLAYVAHGTTTQFSILDVSNPKNIEVLSTISISPTQGTDVRKYGQYVFVSGHTGLDLIVVDVSKPSSPTVKKRISDTGGQDIWPHGMYLKDNYLYVTNLGVSGKYGGLIIYDISNPENFYEVGKVAIPGAHDVFVDGRYAYVTSYIDVTYVTTVDVVNPYNPTILTQLNTGKYHSHILKIGRYLIVGSHSPSTHIHVINAANPGSLSYVAQLGKGITNEGYWMDFYGEDYLITITGNINNAYLGLWDITNPASPVMVDQITAIGLLANFGITASQAYLSNVFYDGEYVYASLDDTTNGYTYVAVIKISHSYPPPPELLHLYRTGERVIMQRYVNQKPAPVSAGGYSVVKSGTATITAGQTLVDVTHGLAATPTRVQLTPTTDTAGKRYWVSAKGATTFTITIDSAHTADISFDWRAVVGEGN